MSSTENGDNPPNGKGYWKLARELMFKNNEAAIFSRCSDLVFFDMLLYQAEFCETRERFFGTQDDNSSSSEGQPRPGLLSTAASWSDLHPGGKTAEQMTEWCDEVRPKLQKYRKSLPNLSCS